MATFDENLELKKFYKTVQQDIKSEQIADEEGGTLEQLFTQFALKLLSDSGDSESPRAAYNEKTTKVGIQHKINGYCISDNYETLDLFITVFNGTDEFVRVGKEDIDKAAKRILAFFKNAVYKDYVTEIEEATEIFELARTLSESRELKDTLVRVNAFILTDGVYLGEIPSKTNISGYPFNYRVVDLNYLYNIFEKSYVPIEIDFKSDGFEIPCIKAPFENDEYESYLAIISGDALANIYERFGSRLLEQNVRSFLQFTGKINKGIRETILSKEKQAMFLAFNNGIAATAETVDIYDRADGHFISKVSDLQIVNGGQTTASIYHTWKKDKVNISKVFVQVKLTVIKNKDKFAEIVSQISEYANTQNKVSVSDLSSNRPYHIELEKLSRNIWAPPKSGESLQSRWFYERARGQYKNARLKEGFTPAKQKAFDSKNPKKQVFTKDDLAKYLNAFEEVVDGKKIVIGPHFVVRGNQKNYAQFINHNLVKKLDSIYFEDIIAKAILFKAAEEVYGVKPNSIGDMRYITVPYSIALFNYYTKGKLDLFKIWKNQAISPNLKNVLRDLMVQVESHIKKAAPGSLYGEWAKKLDCWEDIKLQKFPMDFKLVADDMIDPYNPPQRRKLSEDEAVAVEIEADNEILRSIPAKIWSKIEEWGRVTNLLTNYQQTIAWNLAHKKAADKINDSERKVGLKIIDIAIESAPEILSEIDQLAVDDASKSSNEIAIQHDLIKKIVIWDKRNKRLKEHEYLLMADLADGKKALTPKNSQLATLNYLKVKKYGFRE